MFKKSMLSIYVSALMFAGVLFFIYMDDAEACWGCSNTVVTSPPIHTKPSCGGWGCQQQTVVQCYGCPTTSYPIVRKWWYFRLDAGYSLFDDADGGILFGAGFGKQFNDYLRADITLDYTFGAETDGNNADIEMITGLANVYLDLPVTPWFRPYIGLGVGYAHVGLDPGNSSGNFAFAGMLGAAFRMFNGLDLDVGYRYISAGEVDNFDVRAHQLRIGLRFYF